ncbi:hypothetical protein IGI39_000816 [Enterococcus sp. AZ135]|uniref:hypothetical protein n=1 Tax=unclassified Enterococcus TaxID=2608891 RepID=UPI003F27E80C
MNTIINKHSKNNDRAFMMNRSFVRELKVDVKRANWLSAASIILLAITHSLGVGFKETLFCSSLAILSAIVLNIFLHKFEKAIAVKNRVS